jgi:hypothetical protein
MHVYHAIFEYVPRFCRHVPLTLDSWVNASTRWHVLTQGVLTPKFCSDLRETENVSFDTPRQPTEDTLVKAYLASACMRSFRTGRPDYGAATVAAMFGRPPVAI